MRYKNIIIKCKTNIEFIELQKHLFRLNYSWSDYGNKNRQIKKSFAIFSVLIQNSDTMRYPMDDDFKLYKVVDFIKLMRKEKLKKINNG